MNLQRLYLLLLLLIFVLPVVAAVGWDVSDQVLLSSMEEDLGHIGECISSLVYLSSMSEEENHVGIGISEIIYLSSMEEELNIGEGISEMILLSSLHYGDVDNNTEVESFDTSLILQYAVDLDPAPEAPLPWENWRLTVADVSDAGFVGAYDAALILRYVPGLIDVFPVEGEPVIDRVRGLLKWKISR
ncbi:MAG: dockerin type I domain-containing protein [Candidatus Stygibacter australis]|nr:dockerin type I domain-containing protein [Candidatus Stygibacter australis]MDP8321125.1 dockerin type I domain-containing protein [Candidatus Stygibacter australis]